MNQPVRIAMATALAAIALAAPPAWARPPVPISHPAPDQRLKWDSKKFMHVSELRPGMRGYALTVFKGTKIAKFGIEVLGVVSKFNQGKDYILFRALDGPPVTRALGIAHGMSGSPIYINGRLVGAISMGIPGTQFAKDPIALATPIEDMFDAWSPDLPSKPASLSASPPTGAGNGANKTQWESFQPLDIPLMVSGMTGRGVARLHDSMAPFHFDVMSGGGAGGADTNPLAQGASLVPGSAVGVSLVQGDIDLTATGTVTYRDGNRLLLFGHPLASLGPLDAALTTAYVVDIFPSYQDSIKIGSPIKTVGRIFQDRPFSVGAVIGPQPEMIPMMVSVDDLSIKRHKDYHVRIINHPLLTSQFITQVAGEAIAQVHGDPGDSVAHVSLDVDVEEIGHVRRTNTFYDAMGIDQTAIGDLSSLLSLLSSNSFYPLAVKSVKMAVTIQNRHDTAEIDHLFVKQSRFAPGDTVDVGVVLKPYKRPTYTRMVSVKIPVSTQDGALALNVRGGASDGGGMTSLLGGLIQLRAPDSTGNAANIGQLVKQFVDKAHNDDLVARLTLPTAAISIKGEKLSGLPPTLAQVMVSSHSTGLRTERDEVKVTEPVPYIVTGSQTLTITVRRKDLSEPPRPPSSVGGSPSPSSSGSDSSTPPPDSPPPSTLSMTGGSNDETTPLIMFDTAPKSSPKPPPAPAAGGAGSSPDKTGSPSASDSGSPGDVTSSTSSDTSGDTTPKPVGRLPQVWRQGAMTDFAAGTLKNVAVTSLGDVRLSPSLQKVADTTDNYIWAIEPDGKGNFYLGTGDGGVIYKMDTAGKVSPFYKTGELEVTALSIGSDGFLYAGTAPHGIVCKVRTDGKGGKVFTAQEKYITALASGRGEMFIATGGGTGRVYRLSESVDAGLNIIAHGTPMGLGDQYSTDILFTSPEAHILSLATDKDGNIYAGSAPDGIVYKITTGESRLSMGGLRAAKPQSSVLYDAAETNISALATDSLGNVYAGTTTSGTVYRIAPDGTAKRLLGRAPAGILSLRTDSSDSVYAVTGNTVYRINPDDTVQSYVAQADEQFLSLALDPATNAVYAGTGTVGSVYKIGQASGNTLQGTFQSTVHDAGVRSRWGTLAWTGDMPAGTSVTLQTRTGDVERPDDSWSAWSAPYTTRGGQTVTSPPARYIQYQATLTGDSAAVAGGSVPRLRDVSLYYLTRNRPPTVSIVKPSVGDALSKAALLQWAASDPDKDTLAYDVSYSADSGKTWTLIKKRATPGGDKTPKTTTTQTAESQANLDKQTNVPPAVRAKIAAQVTSGPTGDADANKPAQNLKDTSFTWDTTEVPDGTYQIQVVASDKPSNPGDALTAKAASTSFLIANAKPTLTVSTPTVNADKSVTLHGTAKTGLAFVMAVQGKADSGDPVAASADDGLFDSASESFTLTLPALSTGSHSVEVQVFDQTGNTATQTVKVNVP